MQRPRRTSELHEELGTATKRQSRAQQRTTAGPSPVPGTVHKYSTRQSRIAVPTRSQERARSSSNTALLGVPQPSSAIRGRYTPQKITTPVVTKTSASRVLFTAERAAGGGALHNDKKWVQEQTQFIADHLRAATVPGISSDFFARANSLRQMSTKQFVAIVNYFLQFIWGTRFTVGPNHVDDIVNIMQKLQYPYQVNKSWLKTPNTQHSFGNVIVMLNFLMEFVPPTAIDNAEDQTDEELCFPLDEPHKITAAGGSGDDTVLMQMPDTEFQKQMLRNSKEGFMLWDKKLTKEFESLQEQTADALILKRCGVPGMAGLNVAIDQLMKTRDDLERQRPIIPKEDEDQCHQLEQELIYILQPLEMNRDDFQVRSKQLKLLQKKVKANSEEAAVLEEEILQIKAVVNRQICSVAQRDTKIADVAQLKCIVQSQERTLRDLQDRDHSQKVLLSRCKMKLTIQVEKFNAHMREIGFSQLIDGADLQIPIHPSTENLSHSMCLLKQCHGQAQAKLQQHKNEHKQLVQQIALINQEVQSEIEPTTESLAALLTSKQKLLDRCEQEAKQDLAALDAKLKELKAQKQEGHMQIEQYRQINARKREELATKELENEQIMASAEKMYDACAKEREAYLDKYAAALNTANGEMHQLEVLVEENAKELELLKGEIKKGKSNGKSSK